MVQELKEVICDMPFTQVCVEQNGDVYFCCPNWTGFSPIGNLNKNTFSEIWYGEKAQEFRQQFFDNNFHICKLDLCVKGIKTCISPEQKIPKPRIVIFNYDVSCNQRCIFCRDVLSNLTQIPDFLSEDKIDVFLEDILESAEIVMPSTAGETFFSPKTQELIKRISIKFPSMKFSILTNGLLASPKMFEELNLTNKISQMVVSLHAVHSWTYNKMIKGGNFRRVMSNVRYMSKLKKEGKIKCFNLNFVVNAYNYKEMPKFVKMAEKLGATATFLEFLDMNIDRKIYDKLNVFSEKHPKHADFCKVLANPIFNSKHCQMNDFLSRFHKI